VGNAGAHSETFAAAGFSLGNLVWDLIKPVSTVALNFIYKFFGLSYYFGIDQGFWFPFSF
jgi:hypothetical protein